MRRLLDGGRHYNFIWSEENPTKALSYIATHHSRPQSRLALLTVGDWARGPKGSGDTEFDWLVSKQ